ncbi:hypothetical protein PC129_g15218 [Phytophthora cactorum]|uniref:Helicase-associated domain-containing protein n=2 Tax=Phytophthora cactorum TaxID=29920 RepID=A0A329T3L9_9STRA|nr:hypothetical protein PC111_g13855 [Phytophthora cactorum]KAG2826402.1 hypothetical protein PC112_g9301 [Phytophthora cactorum]KAG2909028.1 hypothetical protein PC114_g10232 [Phytophthora cactorum]KAG2924518.1 hypothetical protein PC115_g8589 [Phytophthora cactorum]KAG2941675.1 hypothetical protein PC117_g10115 [Phytophthora cactorum]
MIEELERVGFVQNVPQFKWDHYVLPSLQTFKKLYGNTDVPYYFVVLERGESWPKLAWGKRLGLTVTVMRVGRAYASQMAGSKEELEKLEFCFSTIAERDWTEKILPSFRIHQREFGHCIIGRGFKVPSCHPWPTKAWEMPLGHIANNVRMGRTYVEQVSRDKEILVTVGFAWNRDKGVWNQQIIPGIRGYAEVFEKGHIPQRFVVPSEEPWPRSTWGMQIGAVLNRIWHNGTYLGYFGRDADKLDAWGVNLKLSTRAWEKRIVPLLDIYATQSGSDGGEGIPDDFVIPSETLWPEEVWGLRLGLMVARNVSRSAVVEPWELPASYERSSLTSHE